MSRIKTKYIEDAAVTTVKIATVNSNVGSFTNANITVNAQGQVTAASNGSGSGGPTIFGSRATPRSVVAATGITTGASHMSNSALVQDIYVEGSVAGDSVSATISAGTIDGQRMTIIGRNDAQTVTLNSNTTNVALNGPITMGAGDVIELRWDTTNWHEMNRA